MSSERIYYNGIDISLIVLTVGKPLTLTLKSDEGSSDIRINACRTDCREHGPNSDRYYEDAIIEGRLPAGVWQEIYGWSNALQLGAVSAGGTVNFEVRAGNSAKIAFAVRSKI